MSEWDPWKRLERERERRLWDPFARIEYERDRRRWDPYFRVYYERNRMIWDPYFRTERLIERKYSDLEYRWRLHEGRRISGDWYETYLENPRDPILRERYELLTINNIEVSTHPRLTKKDLEIIEFAETLSRINNLLYRRSKWDYIKVGFGIGFLGLTLLWLLSLLF